MGTSLVAQRPRARIVAAAALTLVVLLAAVVALLTTRDGDSTASQADAAAAQEAQEAQQTAAAQESVAALPDAELAQKLSMGRIANPGDDFALMPDRCLVPGSSIPRTPCSITTFADRPTVALWGDSHAQMYLPALTEVARSARVNLVALIAGSCPPSISEPTATGTYAGGCEKHNAEALAYVEQMSRSDADFKVVLGGFWSGYRLGYSRLHDSSGTDRLEAQAEYSPYLKKMVELFGSGTEPLFRTLGDLGVSTDVLGQAATVLPGTEPCAAGDLPYQCDIPRARALYGEDEQRTWMAGLMEELPGDPRYIDPSSAYCDDDVCHARIGSVNTFFDDIHLGRTLTASLARFFEPTVEDLVGS